MATLVSQNSSLAYDPGTVGLVLNGALCSHHSHAAIVLAHHYLRCFGFNNRYAIRCCDLLNKTSLHLSARRQIAIYLRPGGFQGHSYREAKYLDTDSAYRLADWPGFVEAAKQALIQRIYGSHSVSYDDLIIGYFEHCQEFHIPFDQDLSELWTQANMCIADRRDDHRASR